jgi:DNA-directed RNA polymerase subunit RPC12/RpoP
MSNIPFVCKKCGAKTFKVSSEPESLDDFDGATCEKCGTQLTKKDIETQARNIALAALKKVIK